MAAYASRTVERDLFAPLQFPADPAHLSAEERDHLFEYAGRVWESHVRRKRIAISSWAAVLAYLKCDMGALGRERFRVLFLDHANQLIADEVMNEGSITHAPVYPREVMRRALELDAASVILVHNHPSGNPNPSSADISMTKQVITAGRALGIGVHDHIVVGADGVASFKALGLI
jgi:DNA repair protein RadC